MKLSVAEKVVGLALWVVACVLLGRWGVHPFYIALYCALGATLYMGGVAHRRGWRWVPWCCGAGVVAEVVALACCPWWR